MKILVLATGYTKPNGKVSSHFIHNRNRYYYKNNIDVSVLSFSAKRNYVYEDIPVFTETYFKKELKNEKFDILVSHAPNIKSHIRFISKYNSLFKNIVFFFHGHEVLKSSEVYPKPYKYKNDFYSSEILRNIYDFFKLKILNVFFKKIVSKSHFVFVSNWMLEMFLKYVSIDYELIRNRSQIIYNCVGDSFIQNHYDNIVEKEYDFITIRNDLDKKKYSIDIVNKLAKQNPDFSFLIVGFGDFFKNNKKANNVIWEEKNLSHDEIVTYLNKSKYALMPTRADSQGVMMCEMATFGIPLITSDLKVSKEVFKDFNNVAFLNNKKFNDTKISELIAELSYDKKKNMKFSQENTIRKEIDLFKKINN